MCRPSSSGTILLCPDEVPATLVSLAEGVRQGRLTGTQGQPCLVDDNDRLGQIIIKG